MIILGKDGVFPWGLEGGKFFGREWISCVLNDVGSSDDDTSKLKLRRMELLNQSCKLIFECDFQTPRSSERSRALTPFLILLVGSFGWKTFSASHNLSPLEETFPDSRRILYRGVHFRVPQFMQFVGCP